MLRRNAQRVSQGMTPACMNHVQHMGLVKERVANERAVGVRVVVCRHAGGRCVGHAAIALCSTGLLGHEDDLCVSLVPPQSEHTPVIVLSLGDVEIIACCRLPDGAVELH